MRRVRIGSEHENLNSTQHKQEARKLLIDAQAEIVLYTDGSPAF